MECLQPICFASLADQHTLPVIFWSCDADGQFMSALGKPLFEMVPNILETTCWKLHKTQPDIAAAYEVAINKKETIHFLTTFKGRTWDCLMVPTHDGGCQGIGVERTIERSLHDQWNAVISSCPFAIAMVAEDGTMLECSPAWARLLGFDPTGMKYQSFTAPDDLPELDNKHRQLIEGEVESYSLEKKYIHADGHLINVLLEVGVIRPTGIAVAYVTNITEEVQKRRDDRIQGQISMGILKGEFQAYYQPIVEIQGQMVMGYEALVRWNRGEKVLSPAAFIDRLAPVFLEQACEAISKLSADGHEYWIAVNIDPRTLVSKTFSKKLTTFLESSEVPKRLLHFEMTEKYLLDLPIVETMLESLKRDGHTLKIDDLGAYGYSNLQMLTLDFFQGVKIDISFTRKMFHPEEGRRTQQLFRALLSFAERLGLEVIVEGIEEERQCQWFIDNGFERCLGQGFLFARPQPINNILMR